MELVSAQREREERTEGLRGQGDASEKKGTQRLDGVGQGARLLPVWKALPGSGSCVSSPCPDTGQPR